MPAQRLNSALIRRLNTALVFHALREHPGSSQRDLCRNTRLDASTVSNIVGRLETDGIVRRGEGTRSGQAGRPQSALHIAGDRQLLGGEIEAARIRVIAAHLDGTPIAGAERQGTLVLDEAVSRLGDAVEETLATLGATHARVIGIGIGVPGLVDRAGHLVLAPNLGWRDAPMAALLSRALPFPVRFSNDTKMAALGERLFGVCRGVQDFVYMLGRSGIGGALFLNGVMLEGEGGLAGEIGHMKLVPGGRKCGCGAHGCTEAYLSELALSARLAERGRPDMTTISLLAAAEAGDEAALAVLDEAGEALGLAIASIVNIINPSRLVLAGHLAALASHLLPAARRGLAANVLPAMGESVSVQISALGDRAVLLGGVGLAMAGFQPLVGSGAAR